MPGKPKPSSHLVFTDGLASVSVFIEPTGTPVQLTREGVPRKADGAVQLGAAAAFTATVEGYRITAVGEVPAVTARAIAESLRPVAERQVAGSEQPFPGIAPEPRAGNRAPEKPDEPARSLRSLGPLGQPADLNTLRPVR